MRTTSLLGHGRLFIFVASLALSLVLCANHTGADEPDPGRTPGYGSIKLKFGYRPDPFSKTLVAGGSIKTELGGVRARVSLTPDFKLHYTAEVPLVDQLPAPLRIYVESKGDTTLLVKLPDGTWVANDDGGGNRNPQLRFGRPQSGWYTIWVGTFGHDEKSSTTQPATLYISELPPGKTLPKK